MKGSLNCVLPVGTCVNVDRSFFDRISLAQLNRCKRALRGYSYLPSMWDFQFLVDRFSSSRLYLWEMPAAYSTLSVIVVVLRHRVKVVIWGQLPHTSY